MTAARPVVIVGGGPTGLTLGSLLARYGIPVMLIEQNTSTVQEPRAVSIDDEALRTMQAVGVVDQVLPEIVLGYGSHYYSAGGRCFLRVQPQTREYGYPRRNAFQQPILEATLRDHLLTQSNVEVWFGSEALAFEQDADEVRLQVRRPDQSTTTVRCQYLLGCDGGRSPIRTQLGIPLEGDTFRERWLIVDILDTKDRSRDTKVFCNPAFPCISLPGPKGTRRFEFMLQNDESDIEALKPEKIAKRLALYSNDDTCTIRRKTVYTFHARLAQRWREGRIFLAGDAAHLSPPFAGQGMNSGIRDAHNLAWKLAVMLQGKLGPALLDTYEVERRDHVWDMIRLALRMGHVMMPRNRVRASALQTAFTLLNFLGPVRDYFGEMKYKPKPHFRQGFFLNPEAFPDPTNLVGRLFPQPDVRAGVAGRFDDVLGDGFALLATPGTSTHLLEQLPEHICAKLEIKRLALMDGDQKADQYSEAVTAIRVDRQFMPKRLDKLRGLVLLRPDRYVAAFLPETDFDVAVQQLEKLIQSTWTCVPQKNSSGCRTAPSHA